MIVITLRPDRSTGTKLLRGPRSAEPSPETEARVVGVCVWPAEQQVNDVFLTA